MGKIALTQKEIADYQKGWLETHPNDPLSRAEAISSLSDITSPQESQDAINVMSKYFSPTISAYFKQ